MPDPTQDKSTYHDEMHRWMAKQSFWHRLKYGRHPGDRSRLFVFVVKAMLFFVIILGLALGGLMLAVKNRVGSEEFSKDLRYAAAETLDARAINGLSVDWSSGMARLRSLHVDGGRSNFFSALDIELVSFPLELSDVLGSEWEIDSFEGRGADMKLRSGAFTDREWQELLSAVDVEQEKAEHGWLSPVVDLSSLRHVTIRDMNIRWGAKAWMAGSLIGCDLEATKRGGIWNVRIEKGRFSQNWIKDAEIEKIVLEIDSSKIRVVEGKLRMPSGSPVSMSGTIFCDDNPEFDLAVRIDDFQFKDFIAEEKAMILTGEFGAEVRISGSVNQNEGLTSKGRLIAEPARDEPESLAQRNRPWLVKFGRISGNELSVFRAFGDAFGVDGIRYFTSERTVIDFVTSMGNLEVTEMTLFDPMVGKLIGGFSYDGKTKLITDGNMILTVKEAVFENNRGLREIRTALFSGDENGRSEFMIDLRGAIDSLTESDAQRVYKAAENDE